MEYAEGSFGYWWTVIRGNKDINGEVYGRNIDCSSEKLTSLYGCPDKVLGSFFCSGNKLTSLEYSPSSVEGHFFCSFNKLVSLKYSPNNIGKDFFFAHIIN